MSTTLSDVSLDSDSSSVSWVSLSWIILDDLSFTSLIPTLFSNKSKTSDSNAP